VQPRHLVRGHEDLLQSVLADHAVFFFSGRRRHTRSTRDWSSDVCSSDLGTWTRASFAIASLTAPMPPSACPQVPRLPLTSPKARSEERRVGKECSVRWGAERSSKDGGGT